MANVRTFTLCVLASALLSLGASSAQTSQIAVMPQNRIVSPVDNAQLITLHGTVSPFASRRNDLGAAPDGLQLNRMHLVLKRSDAQEAALKQLIDDMHTPGSPNYHKWLTPEQFGAQFGPSDQDVAAVTTWLTNQGFNVSKVNPGRQTIEVSGSVAQLRQAFHTQIHQYTYNGQTHYANANDPQIPAALAPVVAGFVSLNNFPIRSYAHSLGKAQYDPSTGQATPQWTTGSSSSGLNFVLSPGDYAVQYDLNPLYSGGINGTGQTIAIINESNINVALVNQFRTLFGLPSNPPQVIIDGNDPGIDGINNPTGPNFASVEAYLDVEWAGAVAPNANIALVIAADTPLQNGLILAAERAVYSNIAPIISVSFGNCEQNLGSANSFISSLWEQAAAQGITVAVSSGDAGSAGCDNDISESYAIQGQAVNGFASTPFNVAVGGTDFYYSQYSAGGSALSNQIATYWGTTPSNSTPAVTIKGVIPEQPWNASQYGLNINSYYTAFQDTTIASAGGGASTSAICASPGYNSSGQCTTGLSGYPKPAWQTGVTGIPADGVRDTPDVSLFASSGINASYYPLCAGDGDCQPASSGSVQISGVGGTSASTPAFAGIMALVNQKVGGRQGNANTILYPLAAQFPNSFHDVTVGNISVPCEIKPTARNNCIPVTNPIVLGTGTSAITEGQIGTGTTPLYSATTGYDLASGLGTIDAANFVNNWNKVVLKTTTTSLTVTPANSVPLTNIPHGTAVTFAGTVTSSGTPSGDVVIMTDNTEESQQSATKLTLSSGAYSGATSNLPGGTYNVWTQYSGDSANAMSTSPKTQVTVTPEASAIDFNIFSGSTYYTPSKPPTAQIGYGTQLMLSALVAPTGQAANLQSCLVSGTNCTGISFTFPTGTVTFADNGSTLNVAAINNEGDAEFNAPFTVGTHSVTAAYSGDKSYNAAPTTGPINFTVVKDTPSLQLNASAISTVNQQSSGIVGANQPLVFSVQVLNSTQFNTAGTNTGPQPVPVAPPTGTMTVSGFPSGVTTTATLTTGVDPYSQGGTQAVEGVANFTIPPGTAAGTYNITFNYSGDSNYNSNSAKFTIPIVTTSGQGLSSSITGSISGTTTTPTARLTISGTVTGSTTTALNHMTKPLWPATGGAVLAVLFLLVPRRRRNWLVVSSILTTLISGIAIGCGGGGSSSSGGGGGGGGGTTAKAPTGQVYVYAGGYYIATFNLVAPSSGAASTFTGTLDSQSIPQGVNQVTLQYSGDSTYVPSAFTLSTNVTNSLADFSLVPASANIQVTAGGAAGTTAINLGSINGFAGAVTLGCSAASGVTCSLPPTATLAAGGSTSATLSVNAPAGTAVGNYNVRVTGTDSTGKYVHTLGITVMVR